MNKQYVQTGSVTITAGGTAQSVEVGFSPSYVKAFSVNNLVIYEHWDGMDDDTSLNTANHDTTQIAVNAAGGITLTANGFTLGTDIADTTSDVVKWIAFR